MRTGGAKKVIVRGWVSTLQIKETDGRLTTSLSVSRPYATQPTTSGRTDTRHPGNTIWIKIRQGKTLHPPHTTSNTGVQLLNPQVIEQRKLSTDHVKQRNNREPSRPSFTLLAVWPWRRRTGRAKTPANDVCTNHIKLVGINRLAGADKVFPPARFGSDVGGDTVAA